MPIVCWQLMCDMPESISPGIRKETGIQLDIIALPKRFQPWITRAHAKLVFYPLPKPDPAGSRSLIARVPDTLPGFPEK